MYWPKIIKSYIRLGVNDFDKELANLKVYEIEKIIRPKKAYPSGGYRVRKKFCPEMKCNCLIYYITRYFLVRSKEQKGPQTGELEKSLYRVSQMEFHKRKHALWLFVYVYGIRHFPLHIYTGIFFFNLFLKSPKSQLMMGFGNMKNRIPNFFYSRYFTCMYTCFQHKNEGRNV